MIIDSFPYFNEKELLELRIKLLHDYVDKFIILEANRTHTSIPKEFTCKDTLRELGIYSDKINVIELDFSKYDGVENPWVRERAQRDAIADYVDDDDYCFITDCDEIINPSIIADHIHLLDERPDRLLYIQLYTLQHRADIQLFDNHFNPVPWRASYACKGKFFNDQTPSQLRERLAWGGDARDWPYPVTYLENQDGTLNGWHFTWMGGVERYEIKSKSYAHAYDGIHKQERPSNFKPEAGKPEYLGRWDHNLVEFNTDLLPQIIYDLPHIKEFLLGKDI